MQKILLLLYLLFIFRMMIPDLTYPEQRQIQKSRADSKSTKPFRSTYPTFQVLIQMHEADQVTASPNSAGGIQLDDVIWGKTAGSVTL